MNSYEVTLQFFHDSRSRLLAEAVYVCDAVDEVEAREQAMLTLMWAIPAVLIYSVEVVS